MAQFEPAYAITKKAEGGWVNHPNDLGLETYAGINRRDNADWEGWKIIDAFKLKRPLKVNETIWDQELIFLVEKFYRERFRKIRAGEINSQAIANLYFDFHVHSGRQAILELQRAVNDLAFPKQIAVDGLIGPETLNAVNSLEVGLLHDRYKQRRKEFLERLIINNPSQKVFEAGWFARLTQFPDLIEKKKI